MNKHIHTVATLRKEGLEEWKINFTLKNLLESENFSIEEKLRIIAILAINTIQIAVKTEEIKDTRGGMRLFLEHLQKDKDD